MQEQSVRVVRQMAGEGRTQAQCREALPEIVAADPPRPVGELSSLRSLIDGAVLDLMRPPSGWPVRKLPSTAGHSRAWFLKLP